MLTLNMLTPLFTSAYNDNVYSFIFSITPFMYYSNFTTQLTHFLSSSTYSTLLCFNNSIYIFYFSWHILSFSSCNWCIFFISKLSTFSFSTFIFSSASFSNYSFFSFMYDNDFPLSSFTFCIFSALNCSLFSCSLS